MSVGLIGFGRLGALLTRYFAPGRGFKVYDRRPLARRIRAAGAAPATLAEVCAQDVVVVAVPMAEFEGAVRRIRGLLKPGALVVDVCSVKEHPVRVMKRLLPRSVDILATHPNFGPDSAAESLKGHKLIYSRVRVSAQRWRKVRKVLESKGLVLVEMSPAEHDRRMASSLVLTHFIGRALIGYGAEPTGVDTEGYKRLLRILQTVQNDSWQLFADMNRLNAYAAPMRRRFLKSLAVVDKKVKR